MKTTILYGNQRKGNTYKAAQIFKDELLKFGDVEFTEFYMPRDLPEFCSGCQLCLSNPCEKCPHSQYVKPILNSLLQSDALIVATPHCGACTMPASLKNLLDHLDFLVITVTPREEIFSKKAFIITTGSGSTSAIREINGDLRHWGINRVYSLGLRMFTDKWDKMSESKQRRFDKALRGAARRFYLKKRRSPYIGTIALYYMSKFVLKKYVGAGNYPYEYWRERGWLNKRPF
jgi:multimeric flavodoxin WrbA